MKKLGQLLAFILVCSPFVAAPRPVAPLLTALTLSPAAWVELGRPGTNIIDYGAFVWLEADAATLQAVAHSGQPYQSYPEATTLHLGGLKFDTRLGAPSLPAGLDQVNAAGPDLHLVQLTGPTKSTWLAQLEAAELQLVTYIHPHSYVVWGEPPADLSAALPFVRWQGPFAPAYRLLPSLRQLTGRQPVRVLLYRQSGLAVSVSALTELAGQPTGRFTLNETWEILSFAPAAELLPEMASVPGVYSIQALPADGGPRGEMSNQINVNNHDSDNVAFPGYDGWLSNAGLSGAGVVMANVDEGIFDTHPDLVNRLTSCSGVTCGGAAGSGHGTRTAGIMAADGASGVRDSLGFLRGQGMAPGATLVEQVFSPWFTQPGGVYLLMTESAQNGAVLSGNSWGPAGTPQGYDLDTMLVDLGVRDAITTTAGNQQLTYVLSFMNGGGGTSSQGSPDEAKNIVTVGSTKMQFADGRQDLAINDLSANSAHGPALDGRIIPHLVAPGCRVDSSSSTTGYSLGCGTSYASPHVAGAAALFFEYYRELYGRDPSPALVKAAFLPVAHDLAGFEDADGQLMGHPFDSRQGWGRLNAAAVVSPTVAIVYVDQTTLFTESGQSWQLGMRPVRLSEPVRLMLVWIDAPGHGLGGVSPAWNNDLNLAVTSDGVTYVGNHFGAAGWSAGGGAYDGRNNSEGIFLETVNDTFTVTVLAANISSDGVPGNDDFSDQDFALVCYNCEILSQQYLPVGGRP